MTSGYRFVLTGVLLMASASTALAQADRAAAIARARAHAQQNAAITFVGADQALVPQDVVLDADGSEHVRFARTYRALRVIGGDLVVHGSSDGTFLGVSQTLSSTLGLSTAAALSSQGAIRQAVAEFAGQPANSKAEL